MRILAHLGVLDEVELLPAVVGQLYRIGVDHVVVFDMGSTDGSLEWLRGHEGPTLDLVCLPNDRSWEELRRRTIESIRKVAADWVLFLDADEFWLPATGSLRDTAALARAQVLTVERFNAVLLPDGVAFAAPPVPERYPDILLHTRVIPHFNDHMLANPDTPWISGVPAAKVMARVGLVEQVAMGGHDIVSATGAAVRERAADLLIAHLPYTSRERFERRLANIAEFFRHSPDYLSGQQGWHWRRLHALWREGRGAEEFARQVTSPARLRELRAEGSVESAAEWLARNSGAPGP